MPLKTVRALVHAFANSLQVVSGNLELGRVDKAKKELRNAAGLLDRLRAEITALEKAARPGK